MEKLEKLVRADNARDYRTFCREIGPGEGLLRQSDYGGGRVPMGKKGGGRGGKKRKKRGEKISDTKQRTGSSQRGKGGGGRVFPG